MGSFRIKKPTAIITGAGGMIAAHLFAELLNLGWNVFTVSRSKNTERTRNSLSWDEFWATPAIVSNADVLFHTAAFIPPNMEDPAYASECLSANAILTQRLADFCASNSNARFIYTSTGQFYRYSDVPASETTEIDLTRRACFYLSSKFLAEQFIEWTASKRKLSYLILRIASCYSFESPRSVISHFVGKASRKEPLSVINDGTETFDFILAEDVARLIARTAQSDEVGIFNCGTGQATTILDVASAVNSIFENPASIQFITDKSKGSIEGFAPL